MPHTFDDAALTGVLGHMNDDHADDNLLIARAFSPLPDVISSEMVVFDGAAGQWRIITADGAEEHIDRLANKYLGVGSYPMRQTGEQRLKVRIRPDRILMQPTPAT